MRVEIESKAKRRRSKRENGFVCEHLAVRRGRVGGGGDGIAGGVSGEAGLRSGVAWHHQVLRH